MIPSKEEIVLILNKDNKEMIEDCGNRIREVLNAGKITGILRFDSSRDRDAVFEELKTMPDTYGVRIGRGFGRDEKWTLEWWIWPA